MTIPCSRLSCGHEYLVFPTLLCSSLYCSRLSAVPVSLLFPSLYCSRLSCVLVSLLFQSLYCSRLSTVPVPRLFPYPLSLPFPAPYRRKNVLRSFCHTGLVREFDFVPSSSLADKRVKTGFVSVSFFLKDPPRIFGNISRAGA